MEKSDNLFLVIGTNPMPNLIAIANRVKAGGNIYLIASSDEDKESSFGTGGIANKIKTELESKKIFNKIEIISVNKNSEKSIIDELEKCVKEIGKIMELNYTGGTKFLSSICYSYFKDKMISENRKVILSYFDNIKDKFIIEENLNQGRKYKEVYANKAKFGEIFSLEDIVKCHNINIEIEKKEPNYGQYGYQFGEKFRTLDTNEKSEIIRKLNCIHRSKDSNEMIKFTRDFISNEAAEYLEKESEKLTEKKKREYLCKFLFGDGFEEYFLKILLDMEESNEVEEFIWSFNPKRKKNKNEMEIDFIIRNGYDITAMSVTMCETIEECRSKLYEIITRAEQLGGKYCKKIFVCLYDDSNDLLDYVKNNEILNSKELLVIGVNNFEKVKESILMFLKGDI